jgi:hypothetical protein
MAVGKKTSMAESAVRLYAPDHPALAHTVRGKLVKERAKLASELADGFAKDWPDVKHRTGKIAGIDTAIAICDEVEKDLRE